MRYSIDGQILTDIADSLRVKAGRTGLVEPEGQEPVIWTSENVLYDNSGPYIETAFSRSEHIVQSFTIPGAASIRLKYIALRSGTLFAYAAPGVHNVTQYGDLPEDKAVLLNRIDNSQASWNDAKELVFENTDSVTFALYVGGGSKSGVYVEVYGLYPDVIKPEEMATAISNLNYPNVLASDIVDRTVTKITAEDLEGVTVIGYNAFSQCTNLEELELPDTVTTLQEMCVAYTSLHELVLPPSVYYIHNKALDYLGSVSGNVTLKMLKDDDIVRSDRSIGGSAMAISNIKEILVPGKLLNAYKTHQYWDKMTSLFKPYDEWTGELSKSASILAFNNTEDITLSLVAFDYVPEVNITTDAPVDISNISVTTEAITFTITAQSTEGQGTITIQTTRADGFVIETTMNARVVAELTPSSYTVTPLEITPYTFALNDAGYYESNNQKKGGSDALCRVDISNLQGKKVVFECINFAESNYDYGRLGKVNQEYTANAADSLYYANFKGKQMATVQEISYTDAIGDCFIYVSFIKDSSGDNNNDSLQFKIRFE